MCLNNVRRSMKLGLLLSAFGAVALGQSLTTFTCTPTTFAPGASSTCTATISAAAPMAGFPIKISTTAKGFTYPATVTIPWTRTSSAFQITTTTGTLPQVATFVATAGTVTKSVALTVSANITYSLTSLSCSPARLIPEQTALCAAYLSAQAPAGGLVATLTSSSTNLAIPASVNIPVGGTGFTFQASASSVATLLENVTVTAVVKASTRTTTVTVDPTPKFYLSCNGTELGVLADGATVTPSVAPATWVGALTVRGAGSVALNPIAGGGGCSFHENGAQNDDTAFVNFSAGSTFGQVFDNASEISFRVKSAYSFAERQLLPDLNMRGIFEVFDDQGPWYNFSTYTTSSGQLQFSFGARGFSGIYTVPAGQEDAVFGKDVVAKIRIKWTSSAFSLYINDTLVQTNSISPKTANWSAQSAFTIGSRSIRTSGGGWYASDDTIAEFVIR
jgi:hypothetical protein